MYNKIIVAGNLTRDIEMKYTQSGTAIASTAIASTRKFKGQDGQQKEEVLFVDITMFGRTAEVANEYIRKGSKILVDGKLKLDQWTQDDGTKRSKHSIMVENLTMLGSKEDGEQNTQQNGGYNNQQNNNNNQAPNGGYNNQQNNNNNQAPNGGYNQNQQNNANQRQDGGYTNVSGY